MPTTPLNFERVVAADCHPRKSGIAQGVKYDPRTGVIAFDEEIVAVDLRRLEIVAQKLGSDFDRRHLQEALALPGLGESTHQRHELRLEFWRP